MFLNYFLKFCCLLLPLPVIALNVAITFDDHPMPDGRLYSMEERTAKLVGVCERHQIQCAFYCVGARCKDPQEIASLILLNSNGHYLANHSTNHLHFSGLSLAEFEAEIAETDALLTPYTNMRKWFRFPYLDYGNRVNAGGSEEKAVAARRLLQKLDYQDGHVTINTFDWHINGRLQQALADQQKINYDALKELYLCLLQEWCQYYAALYASQSAPFVHTLLFHANDLNALYLEDIIQMLECSNWTIVSPELAMSDTSWRAKLLDDPNFAITKPSTLDCQIIDALLDTKHIFTD